MTVDENAVAVASARNRAGTFSALTMDEHRDLVRAIVTAYLQALRPGSTGETLAIRDALAKADEDDLYREVANRLETPWTAPNGRSYGPSKPSSVLAAAGGEG